MSAQQSLQSQPPSDLLADDAKRDTLLSLAFDVSWEMRLEGSQEIKILILQDLGVHLGFRPGEFPRTL